MSKHETKNENVPQFCRHRLVLCHAEALTCRTLVEQRVRIPALILLEQPRIRWGAMRNER